VGTDIREILMPYTGGAQAAFSATTESKLKRAFAFEATTTATDSAGATATATVFALPVFDMGPGGTGGGGGVSDPVIRTANTTSNLYVLSDAWTGSTQPGAAMWMDSRVTRATDTPASAVVAVSVAAGGAGGGLVTIASPTHSAIIRSITGADVSSDTVTTSFPAVVAMGPNTTVVEGGETFHAGMVMATVSKIPANAGAANLYISSDFPANTKARMAVHFDPLFTATAAGPVSVIRVSDVNMGAGGGGTNIAHVRNSESTLLWGSSDQPAGSDVGVKVHASQVGVWTATVTVANTLSANLMTNTSSGFPWIFSNTTAGAESGSQMALDVWARIQSNTVSDYAYVGNASPLGASVQPRLAVWCRQDNNQTFTVSVSGGQMSVNQTGPWNISTLNTIKTNQNAAGLYVFNEPWGLDLAQDATSNAGVAVWMDSRVTTAHTTVVSGTKSHTKVALLVSDLAGGGAGGTDIHLAAQSNSTAAYVSRNAWTNTTVAAMGVWMDSRLTSDAGGTTSTVLKVSNVGAGGGGPTTVTVGAGTLNAVTINAGTINAATINAGTVRATNSIPSALGVSAFVAISRPATTQLSAHTFSHGGAGDSTQTVAFNSVNCANMAWFNVFVRLTGSSSPGPCFIIPQVSNNGSWHDYDFGFWKQLAFAGGDITGGLNKAWKVPALGSACRILVSQEAVNSTNKVAITAEAQAQNVY